MLLRIALRPTRSNLCQLQGQRRWLSTNDRVFREKDVVVLRLTKDPEKIFLSKPLKAGNVVTTHHGDIKHDDIISKCTRETVSSTKGINFRVQFPTTEEYITRVRRMVTPIYPQDAATIVSLLDIHVSPPIPNTPRGPPLEILEAGTGHGSLTLALAKEIHAANPMPSPAPSSTTATTTTAPDATPLASQGAPNQALSPEPDSRNSIIHTLDISTAHSSHAQKVISNFRRGIYSHNISFHTGDPNTWISSQQSLRGSTNIPFLSIILLDLPSPEDYLESATHVLHPDGIVGVFCPSITQIAEIVQAIKDGGLPLVMDKVVEFANNGGIKQWDVRLAKIRSKKVDGAGGEGEVVEKMVCRPAVGGTLVGGGFFAMFRRKEGGIVRPKEKKVEVIPSPAPSGLGGWLRGIFGR